MSGYDCRNKWLFSFWRNVVRDGADWTSTGRLFQSGIVKRFLIAYMQFYYFKSKISKSSDTLKFLVIAQCFTSRDVEWMKSLLATDSQLTVFCAYTNRVCLSASVTCTRDVVCGGHCAPVAAAASMYIAVWQTHRQCRLLINSLASVCLCPQSTGIRSPAWTKG